MCEDFESVEDTYFANWYNDILSASASRVQCTNIDKFDSMGRTALHWAALRNDYEAVCSLLQKGADPNVPGKRFGGSAINFAARSRCLTPRIIYVLLHYGADINSSEGNTQTSLIKAVAHGPHATKILIDAGANVNQQNGVTIAQNYGTLDVILSLQKHSKNALQAFEVSSCSLTLSEVQMHREWRGVPPVSAEWWAMWNDIFQFSSGGTFEEHFQVLSSGNTDVETENSEDFVDAVKFL
jgi:hypothetical protein